VAARRWPHRFEHFRLGDRGRPRLIPAPLCLPFVEALPALNMRPSNPGELTKAGRIVKKFADQNLTLADAHGLALMQELRVGSRWSTDRHLSLTGVPLVI